MLINNIETNDYNDKVTVYFSNKKMQIYHFVTNQQILLTNAPKIKTK